MYEFAKQLSAKFGIDQDTADQVADYVAEHWQDIAGEVGAAPMGMDDRDVPTDSPEDTQGRIDDDEGWVLKQADSC